MCCQLYSSHIFILLEAADELSLSHTLTWTHTLGQLVMGTNRQLLVFLSDLMRRLM